MQYINSFQGDYRFLSNFHVCNVMFEGQLFKNAEAAFQAAKCENPDDKIQFQDMPPGEAKHIGRRVKLRPDWEDIKLDVMHSIVRDKFTRNPELKQRLLDTGNAMLTEGNKWHDLFWGVDYWTGLGKNHLGKILMTVREELKDI